MNNKFILFLVLVSISGALALLTFNNHSPRKAPTEETRPVPEASPDGLALRAPVEQNVLRSPLLAQSHTQGAQPQTPPSAGAPAAAAPRPTGNAELQTLPARVQPPSAPQQRSTAEQPASQHASTTPVPAAQQRSPAQQAPRQQPAATRAAQPAPQTAATPAPARAKEKRITGIRITPSGSGTTVAIGTTESVRFKQTRLTSPERLVLDFEGAWKVRAPGVPENTLLSNVRIGKNPDRTRIVLDLKKKARVTVAKTANGLEVQLK